MNQLILSIPLIILTIFYYNDGIPRYGGTSYMLSLIVIVCVSIVSFLFFRKEHNDRLKKQYVKICYFFILSYCIVHFQIFIDLLLGNLDLNNSFMWFDKSIVPTALTISTVGLLAYMLGYSLFYKKQPEVKPLKKEPKILNVKILNIISVLLMLVYFYTIDKDYFRGQYGEMEVETLPARIMFLFLAVVNAVIIINCRNLLVLKHSDISLLNYIKYQKTPFTLLYIFLLLDLISGNRDAFVMNSLFVFFSYFYVTKRKIKLRQLFLLVILGAMSLSILGLARKYKDNASFKGRVNSALAQEYENNNYPYSVIEITKELAASGRVLNSAVSVVPNKFPHTYGLFAFQDVLLMVPMAKTQFISTVGIPKAYTSSAQFLTWVELGQFSTWGVGTSCVADTYLDFGFIGVMIIFFLFGVLSRRLESLAYSDNINSFYIITLMFLFFAYTIYIPRGTILYSLNKYTYILFFILVAFLSNRKSKKV